MTDPLGQSQVLPYLVGLSKIGYKITLISLEKPDKLSVNKDTIEQITKKNQINWQYELYETHKIGLIANFKNQKKLKNLANSFHQHFDIVHCRSYVSAIIGLDFKNKKGSKFIFDMRGFWADERVDGKIWNLKKPIYFSIYHYFKHLEKSFLSQADQVITLTQKAKDIITSWGYSKDKITVVPCCADLSHFTSQNIDKTLFDQLKNKFGITENTPVLSYLGSIGTWYMLDKMLDFYKVLVEKKPNTKFLFITQENKELVLNKAKEKGINTENIIVSGAKRTEVPTYLALSNWSVFFILPTFSKQASSPTKLAEIVSMGIPVICNAGVGDVETHVKNGNFGEIIYAFDKSDYEKAVDNLLQNPTYAINKEVLELYSVEKGIETYKRVYESCLNA
jgi:glycosyltransferase involved in cell wall biosynthesis